MSDGGTDDELERIRELLNGQKATTRRRIVDVYKRLITINETTDDGAVEAKSFELMQECVDLLDEIHNKTIVDLEESEEMKDLLEEFRRINKAINDDIANVKGTSAGMATASSLLDQVKGLVSTAFG